MNTAAAPAARTAGRERNCDQCGTTYRAQRSTSRYCSAACRQQARRGVPPVNPQAPSVILSLLFRLGYAGQIGPVNRRDPRPAVYGLTVPRAHALAELSALYDRKGWGVLTEAELAAELKAHGILAHDESPKPRKAKR